METLWSQAEQGALVDIQSIPPELLNCVQQGDGVADHYGGRTAYTFLSQRNNRILTLEHLPNGNIKSRTIINLTGGYGTGILGDEIKSIGASLAGYLENAVTTNDEFHSLDRFRLASTIKRLLATHTATDQLEWEISFTSTGSEAMDLALQLIYLNGFNLTSGIDSRKEKNTLVACHGAWHGWSLGANQLVDRRQFTEGLPRVSGFQTVFMQYGNIENLKDIFEKHRGRIRAISVEGILGDGGVIPASKEWWQTLFECAAIEDARIIDDEILTGFRCGSFLAIPRELKPDCVVLGKALGFGLFPISAVAWRKDVLSLRAGIGVRTFNARPFQAAVVNACLEKIEVQDLFFRSAVTGRKLLERLKDLIKLYPEVFKDVRGQGLFIGIELSDNFARRGQFVRNQLMNFGVLTETESGIFSRKVPKEGRVNETIRLTPPLTIDYETLTDAIARIQQCAASLRGQT